MSTNRLRAGLPVAVLLLAAVLIAGCGKKGPLYLPTDGKPTAQTPSAETQDKDKTKH